MLASGERKYSDAGLFTSIVAAIGAQDLCVYNHSEMVFQLKCSLIPKNPRSLFGLRVIWLNDFCPHSHVGAREARLHLQQLWHVSMLFWRYDPHLMQQLTFCFGNGLAGKALSKKCFAGQPCECISQVCRLRECKLSIMNCLAADNESKMYLRCTLGFYFSWGTPELVSWPILKPSPGGFILNFGDIPCRLCFFYSLLSNCMTHIPLRRLGQWGSFWCWLGIDTWAVADTVVMDAKLTNAQLGWISSPYSQQWLREEVAVAVVPGWQGLV